MQLYDGDAPAVPQLRTHHQLCVCDSPAILEGVSSQSIRPVRILLYGRPDSGIDLPALAAHIVSADY